MKAVLFDLDGTLIDTIDDITRVCNHVLQGYGVSAIPAETYLPWVGRGLKKLLLSVLEEYRVTESPDVIFTQIVDTYRQSPVVYSRIFPGITEMLAHLSKRAIPMAILSNKEQKLVEAVVANLLPEVDFFAIRGNNDRFPTKPDPSQALDIAQQISCSPSQILFVGDSLFDMQTAESAGMKPLWVNWGYGTYPQEKDYLQAQKAEVILQNFPRKI